MNHYDEDKSAITAALMGLSCEGDCGPLGILMHCAVLTLVFCAATIAITLPSATRKILKKVYNSADGTPDRSEEEMLQAHPQAAKLCRVHKHSFPWPVRSSWCSPGHRMSCTCPLYTAFSSV